MVDPSLIDVPKIYEADEPVELGFSDFRLLVPDVLLNKRVGVLEGEGIICDVKEILYLAQCLLRILSERFSS